jgi:hypothetical protein
MEVTPAPGQTDSTKTKQKLCVCNKSATILQHVWNTSATCLYSLQLYRVHWPVGKDQRVSVLLQDSLTANCPQRSADLSQYAEVMYLKTWNWSTEDTCKLAFFVYSILASPKHISCLFFPFNIFHARNIQPVAARRMSTSSFSLKPTLSNHFTTAGRWLWAEQNSASRRKLLRFVACVGSSLSSVSALCLSLQCGPGTDRRAKMSLLPVVSICWTFISFLEERFMVHFVWLQYTKRIAFYCETVPHYVVQDTSCVL